MMKVNIGKEFYVVHWQKRQFHPKYGKNFDLELAETTCVIKTLETGGNTVEIGKYSVRQNINDQSNDIQARKLSFTGVLKPLFDVGNRRIFWEEYKKTMRLTPRTLKVKYRELEKENKRLQHLIGRT